jgi:hypothetical protein
MIYISIGLIYRIKNSGFFGLFDFLYDNFNLGVCQLLFANCQLS